MKKAVVELVGISPYSQSRYYETPKLAKELPKDYEERTWRDRLHVDQQGYVFIPPMSFKIAISEAASYLGMRIPGKNSSTYTKHFTAGILVTEALTLKIKKADVPGEWLFVPSDGKRGGGKRVPKCFPVIHKWRGAVLFYILDDIITEDVFKRHLDVAGNLIGIGRFRPRNNGYYGRFRVEGVAWEAE